MTSTPAAAVPSPRPTLRLTPTTAGLLAVALVAWAAALARARHMGNGSGTIGMVIGLTAVVVLEKVSRHGWGVSWLTGVAALVLAAVVLVAPGIAGGLVHHDRRMPPAMDDTGSMD